MLSSIGTEKSKQKSKNNNKAGNKNKGRNSKDLKGINDDEDADSEIDGEDNEKGLC